MGGQCYIAHELCWALMGSAASSSVLSVMSVCHITQGGSTSSSMLVLGKLSPLPWHQRKGVVWGLEPHYSCCVAQNLDARGAGGCRPPLKL